MPILRVIVPPEWDQKTLREFLQTAHGVSGTTLKHAKRIENGITQNGVLCRTVDPVIAGAEICLTLQEKPRNYHPYAIHIPVLWEDEHFIAFDKPQGLAVHPSKGHPCDTLANAYATRPETQGLVFHPLNRLDRDTSGIVLVAKNAHAAYAAFITEKRYQAILCGKPQEESGTINLPIAREGEDTQKRCVRPDGKRAVTHYHILAAANGCSLAELWLETGRTHQIRVHMAQIGCPLLGDPLYGTPSLLLARQALHCTELHWHHPITGEDICILSPMPKDMQKVASVLGLL